VRLTLTGTLEGHLRHMTPAMLEDLANGQLVLCENSLHLHGVGDMERPYRQLLVSIWGLKVERLRVVGPPVPRPAIDEEE
jgi:hypothetical protein